MQIIKQNKYKQYKIMLFTDNLPTTDFYNDSKLYFIRVETLDLKMILKEYSKSFADFDDAFDYYRNLCQVLKDNIK